VNILQTVVSRVTNTQQTQESTINSQSMITSQIQTANDDEDDTSNNNVKTRSNRVASEYESADEEMEEED
jgi:hypothetical protein